MNATTKMENGSYHFPFILYLKHYNQLVAWIFGSQLAIFSEGCTYIYAAYPFAYIHGSATFHSSVRFLASARQQGEELPTKYFTDICTEKPSEQGEE
jgi:hypothetical protein